MWAGRAKRRSKRTVACCGIELQRSKSGLSKFGEPAGFSASREMKCLCPGFDEESIAAMKRHPWRGNVRELENVVERAVIFAGDKPVMLHDLSIAGAVESIDHESTQDLRRATRQFERQHIINVLERTGKNKNVAAEALGIGLSSLYRKMEELNISRVPSESLPG